MKKFIKILVILGIIGVGACYLLGAWKEKKAQDEHNQKIEEMMTELLSGTIAAEKIQIESAIKIGKKTSEYDLEYIIDREKKLLNNGGWWILDLKGGDHGYYSYSHVYDDEWEREEISSQVALQFYAPTLDGRDVYRELLSGNYVKSVEKVKETTLNGEKVTKYRIEYIDPFFYADWEEDTEIYFEDINQEELEQYQELYDLIKKEHEKLCEDGYIKKYIWVNEEHQLVKLMEDNTFEKYLSTLSQACMSEEIMTHPDEMEYKKEAIKEVSRLIKEEPKIYIITRYKYNDKCQKIKLPKKYTEVEKKD